MKTLILFLLLSVQSVAADLYLRNDSGTSMRVKIRNDYHDLGLNKTIKSKLNEVFKSEVQAIYQNRTVASTQVSPSSRDTKLRLYKKNGVYLLEIDKRL